MVIVYHPLVCAAKVGRYGYSLQSSCLCSEARAARKIGVLHASDRDKRAHDTHPLCVRIKAGL